MPDQQLSAVSLALMREQVQVLDTKFAVVGFVLSSDVLVQLTKGLEILLAFGALVVKHCKILVLDLLCLKAYFELSVHWIDVVLYQFKLGLSRCKYDLKKRRISR